MPLSEARKRANKKWNDENMKERYDRIQIVVPKGERAELAAYAKEHGETLSGFALRTMREDMQKCKVKKTD